MKAKSCARKLLRQNSPIKRTLGALALLQIGVASLSHAATLYWDTNGSVPGSGGAPYGVDWVAGGNTWSLSPTGVSATSSLTTGWNDDLFFAAGDDAVDSYVITVNDVQKARFIIIRSPQVYLTGGTIDFQNSNSGIIFEGTNQSLYVHNALALSGASYINTLGATNSLLISSASITRNRQAALNFRGAGTVTVMDTAGLETDSHDMLGGWVTHGTGGSTAFAAINGEGKLVAHQGTVAANASALTGDSTTNYDLTNATGTAPTQITANSIRYRGSAGTTTLGSGGMQVNALLNSSGATWTLAGGSLTASDTQELILNASSGTITANSAITDNDFGSVTLTKHGAGTVELVGNNSFTGNVYIQQGVLSVRHTNALGSGSGVTYINNNGSTSLSGALALQGNTTITEDIFIYGTGDGSISVPGTSGTNWNSVIYSSSGNNTIVGTITLIDNIAYRFGSLTDSQLNVGTIKREGTGSASVIFSASGTGLVNVTEAIKINGGSVTMHGGGWARFAASNNEIGDVNVSNTSELILAADQALNVTKTLNIGNSSSGSGNDVGGVYLEGVKITINTFNGNKNSSGTIAASNQRILSGYSANDSTLEVGYNNGGGSFDGVILDGTRGGKLHFTKLGTGTQNLLGTVANTHTGLTKVHGGMLHLGKTANVNAVSGDLEIGDAQVGLDIVRLGANEQIADSSRLTFNGELAVAGVLRLNGSSETVAGVNSVNRSGIVENASGSSASKLTVAPALASDAHAFDGILQNGGTAALSFEKTGLGSQALSGASTYTGGTEVKAGTLYVNNAIGSATGSGGVNVQAAGTLAGSGRIALATASRVNLQGTLSPGAAPDTVGSLEIQVASASGTNTSGVSLTNAKLQFDLAEGGTAPDAFGSSDRLVLSGVLNEASDLHFSGSTHFDFDQTGQLGWYKLIDTSATDATTWTGITVNQETREITDGLSFASLGSGLSGMLFLGNGGSFGDYGDVYLRVVPEPTRAALVLLGLVGFVARRSRR